MKSTVLFICFFITANIFGQVSQSVTAASWSDGPYKWWKSNYSSFYLNLETEKKDLKFTKNDKGEVTEVTIGKRVYVGDEHGKSEYIRYYESDGSDWNLFFTAKYIVIFKPASNNGIQILGCIKAKCKATDKDKIKKYLEENRQYQEAELNAYALKEQKANELAALEEESKFSIKDKSVKSIEIVNLVVPEKFGHFRNFTFDVKAMLTDGTELSTMDGGFWSDYEISYGDAPYDGMSITGKIIEDDKITITVTSKFDPSIKTTKEVVLKYNEDISFSHNGLTYSRSAGDGASSFKIEIKQTLHKVTKEKLLMYRITNESTGELVAEFKISAQNKVVFKCNGGGGGTEDGRGNDGGNGGNITVIKDPNVENYNLSYSNNAGRGGKGSMNSYNGRDGRDGTFNEETKAVSF